ncbi:DAO-domain-containing protein [Aspergillus sclerotioniger CBS 115572]|uniref:DAO-domain-containing protein n=1 Tax=Aspergillus sclerotioniger CBS 115572 TaxID=1450535 RepID=A0A317WND0_9EURO|nr:DAO-domain-containing protein [Aspergillus sclerotioniger CBS 115572]PWY87964.1 DAO-domain-containing protein [Aspergillus sclerotioniger CBS 115572]
MGAILSSLRTIYLGICVLLADFADSNADYNALLGRISAPIHPIKNPSTSFWQQRPPFPELVDIQSPSLPDHADIVIIGSGISGASIAYTLLTQSSAESDGLKVVLLEARELCSGATGRNGGHVKCASYSDYALFKRRFGRERAKKLLEFERRALPLLVSFAQENGFEVAEARKVETLDVITDAGMWEKTKNMVQELKEDVPEAGKEVEVFEPDEGCEIFELNREQCCGVIRYPAGAIWPYRFVTSLYARLLSEFGSRFSIETNTPVVGIETRDDVMPFMVSTSRGKIPAYHVIHATDAFVANLVPGATGKLFPMRGHMTAQTPGAGLSRLDGSRSWSIIGKRGFDYITQRPRQGEDGGELMVGGGVVQSPSKGIDEFGIWRDDQMSGPISAYLEGIMPVTFGRDRWGEDKNGTRIKGAWVGCMGFTCDLLPLVGKLEPGLTVRTVTSRNDKQVGQFKVPPAEWISAGFNGEGMVLAWLCGVAVGLMALGLDEMDHEGGPGIPPGKVKDWLPDIFICSKRRVERFCVAELGLLM